MSTEREVEREKVLKRLQRIEGQIRGIRSMIEDERCCKDILTQMLAVSGAMKGTISLVIKTNFFKCIKDMKDGGAGEEDTVEELVKVLLKAM